MSESNTQRIGEALLDRLDAIHKATTNPEIPATPFNRLHRPPPDYLSNHDCDLIVSTPPPAKPTPHRLLIHAKYQLLILIMLDAGLRAGEAAGLIISDAYYNSRPRLSIEIRAAIAKSKRSRTIPLSPRLQEALSAYALTHTPPLFVQDDLPLLHAPRRDTPLTTRQLQRIINDISKARLGHVIHPHVLRHTFATRLSQVAPLKIVQELLGHVDLSSTQIYLHTTFEEKAQAVALMSRLQGPQSAPPTK